MYSCMYMYEVYYSKKCPYIYHLIHAGLPVPIVAIAAGISIDRYGSENGLAYF